MTREERENAMRCLKLWIEREPYIQTYKTCLEALEQEPKTDIKQAYMKGREDGVNDFIKKSLIDE